MKFLAYLLGTALGYLVGRFLPENPLTPYIPLLLSYHIFLFFLLTKAAVKSEQKIGLSTSLPMAFVTHLAFLGAMIAMVLGRHLVPFFEFVQFAVPGLAPFEVKWLFEGKKERKPVEVETKGLPQCTIEEYNEFLNCMKRGERQYLTARRTVHDEFAAWLVDYRRKKVSPPVTAPATEVGTS